MDLTVTYLTLELDNPLLLGASPLVDDLDAVRRAEDAGAAAIVMHSLFEEQLTLERRFWDKHLRAPREAFAQEGLYYLPERSEFTLDPDSYLEQIRRLKAAVGVPVIGSLNGTSPGPWLECARLIDQAGADAIELNLYRVNADPDRDAESIEAEAVEMVRLVRSHTELPLAVKLSPFYSSLPHFAKRLVHAGANGFVLFNRFYQPDMDLEIIDVRPRLELSTSEELPLRLRWLAILSAGLDATLAASGGVHSGVDALKAIAAGAHGVQLVSEILKHGPRRFTEICGEMREWLEANGYASVRQLRGALNLSACPNPAAYERVNYVHTLSSWAPPKPSSAPPESPRAESEAVERP